MKPLFDRGRDSTILACNRKWTLSRFTVRILRGQFDWLREVIGDPLADLERFIDKVPPSEAMKLIKEANSLKVALKTMNSNHPAVKEYLGSPEGVFKTIQIQLGKHHPDVADEVVWDIVDDADPEELGRALAETCGQYEGNGAGAAEGQPTAPTGTK